jgi:hypothetical protein
MSAGRISNQATLGGSLKAYHEIAVRDALRSISIAKLGFYEIVYFTVRGGKNCTEYGKLQHF